jgi:hypothetical protein
MTERKVSLASVSPFKADLKQEFLKPGDVPPDYAQMLQLLDDKNIRAKLDQDLDKQKTMKLVSILVKEEENEQKIREKFGHNQKELKQQLQRARSRKSLKPPELVSPSVASMSPTQRVSPDNFSSAMLIEENDRNSSLKRVGSIHKLTFQPSPRLVKIKAPSFSEAQGHTYDF